MRSLLSEPCHCPAWSNCRSLPLPLFSKEWCQNYMNGRVGSYCAFKKFITYDSAHPQCTPDSSFQVIQRNSWSAWEFSKHQYLLFSLLNENYVWSEKTWVLDKNFQWLTLETTFLY
jgi:hypothetical protein